MTHTSSRRTFIGTSAAVALAACSRASSKEHEAAAQTNPTKPIPKRQLGATGVEVSIVGLGGYHLGNPDTDEEAIRIVRAAIDRGVTFLDNCWDYHGGKSEERMGKALRDGYRDRAFLMTKIDGRTKGAAAEQIDQSLRRLRVDHVDLLQLHEVIRMEDPARVFAPGGAIEALVEARRAGKIRFVGFTGHKDPTIHRAMLEAAKEHGFHFDAVQMPLNVMDAHFKSFEREVLPTAAMDGIAVLGMKPLGSGEILESGVVTAIECLRYAMSLPVSVTITGCERMKDLDQAVGVAAGFRPLSPSEKQALLAKTAHAAERGEREKYKTSDVYDSTAHHPQWLDTARP